MNAKRASSSPEDEQADSDAERSDKGLLSGAVYSIVALALAATLVGLIVALGVASDATTTYKFACTAGIAVVLAGVGTLVYFLELRRRTLHLWRTEALDLAAAVASSCERLAVPWLTQRPPSGQATSVRPGHLWETAIARIQEIESLMLDAGAFQLASTVSDARRHAEARICERGQQ